MDEKEDAIVKEFENKLKKELKYLSNKEKELTTQLDNIQSFHDSWKTMGEQNDGNLLEQMAMRHQEADQAIAEPKQMKFNSIFTKVNRESEFAQFSKHIL